jgi:hypothetical protein
LSHRLPFVLDSALGSPACFQGHRWLPVDEFFIRGHGELTNTSPQRRVVGSHSRRRSIILDE